MSRVGELRQQFDDVPFTRRQALEQGFSTYELDKGGLHRPFRGVREFEEIDTLDARCRAYATKMPDTRAFTGLTAASIRGWPVPKRAQGRRLLDVAGLTSLPRVREAGIRYVRVADHSWERSLVDGLPVVAAEIVLLDLARACTLEELVVLGDAAVTASTRYPNLADAPSTSIEALAIFLDDCGLVAGKRLLRRALALMREGVDSPMETLTRLKIVASGLPEPEVAGEIWEDGVRIATGDLVFRAARVIVEYDGEYHRQEDAWERDIERIRRLERYGWKVIRVTKRGLFPTSDRFLDDLRAALRERGGLQH